MRARSQLREYLVLADGAAVRGVQEELPLLFDATDSQEAIARAMTFLARSEEYRECQQARETQHDAIIERSTRALRVSRTSTVRRASEEETNLCGRTTNETRRSFSVTRSKYSVVSAEEIEETYEVSSDVEYPYADFAEEQEQRLYRGGLDVAGDFCSEPDVDWNPYNLVIDGDLQVDGTIRWVDYGSGCFVLVTGDLRCKNLLLQGCPTVVVRGNLVVENGIQGHHGDDGGFLIVRGTTKAKVIVNTLYFNMEFGTAPEALVCGDEHRTNCPLDFTDDELAEVFLPELLDKESGGIDEHEVERALGEGQEVLRRGIRPSHLAALDEIEALIAEGARVTELDLTKKKLRGFPTRILELTGLRRLVLRENALGELPVEIAKLTELESLDIAECDLESLPETFSQLTNLKELDVSKNPFERLPESIARLPKLRVLRANMLRGTDIDAIGNAPALEELELSFFKPGKGEKLVPFPRAIARLVKLRSLSLSFSALSGVPDEITKLRELESLDLDNAIGRLERLPPLHELPRLRVLKISGGASNTGSYAPHALLDGVWSITTLEHLGIDRYGAQEPARPALAALPADAFAKMPNLRVLDVSFNELTHLPESFYALTKLESVDLRYTKLDKASLDRLRTTFPKVKLDLRNVKTRFDVDDPNWKAVHANVKAAASHLRSDRNAALSQFKKALALCTPGASYSDYDELYALYGIVDALSHLRAAASGSERESLGDELIHYATLALEHVPAPGMIWHFTDEGAFQEEVTRRAGNALAWILMERGNLDAALRVVERALSVGGKNEYVLDTKVRILLASSKEHDAFLIVDRVLTADPAFQDFQDLKSSENFQAWRTANGPRR